jgi:pilus assembly protein CpaF
MTDRLDPTALPIFGATPPAETPPNGHGQVPTISLASPSTSARSLAGPIAGAAPVRAAAVPAPASVPPVPARPAVIAPGGIDWHQVAMLRAQASDQLTAALGEERGMDPETERELGRTIIQELLQTTTADRLHDGEAAWSMDEQDAMAVAVYNALFGLGRLQPLVDDDTVENIIITGAQNVWVEKVDGTLIKTDPVADSDQELLDFLSFVASRSEVNARSFSSANPRLHMRLDGGPRLAAAAWVTAHPSVVIRRHRLRRVTLDELVERDMITPTQASFLRAAIKARKSVVVAGPQGAGKTTMVRALCAEINPWEAIGTFETEFELHLHELTDVHPIVHAWEARPGSGEVGPDGKQAGEFTLDEALYDSFRFNLSRQIVGEVRGREVWAMIKAMESGAGSISTTHAGNGEGAIRKLVTCAMEAGPHVTKELATSKLAETVDLVVQVHLETVPLGDGKWRRSRWVSEIVHVAPGEAAKGYAVTHVFRPNPAGGPAVPGTLPDELRELEQYGFDINAYLADNGREAV